MLLASERFAELFCTVVETGSFTAAAHALGITPAAVSRAISRHEERFGVALFRRTTRSMKLSDAGDAYFQECRQAVALLERAEHAATQTQATPRGTVRISVPTTYGHYRALPAIARFRDANPDVSLDVHIGNRNVDFVTEGYDLAIRAGELDDSTLVARKLEDARLGLYASPDYLGRRGKPRSPDDLARHALIGFVRPSTGRPLALLMTDRDGSPFELPVKPAIRCSDDFLGCVTLARAGAGIVQAFEFIVERDVESGVLVEILPRFTGRTRPFHLLMPARTPTLAVRRLADALVEKRPRAR